MYNYFVFSGGAYKGYAFLGSLEYLYSRAIIKDPKFMLGFTGTSIGALYALMCSVGIPIGQFRPTIDSFLQKYGISQKSVESMVYSLINQNTTFNQLYKQTGQILVIVAAAKINCSNIDYKQKNTRPVYFSHIDTPTVSVADAVIAAMSVPIFMKPKIINNGCYIDGGLLNNFPMNVFPYKDTLGFNLDQAVNLNNVINIGCSKTCAAFGHFGHWIKPNRARRKLYFIEGLNAAKLWSLNL